MAGSPELSGQRTRAAWVSGLAVGGTALLLLALPLPQSTRAEGVVWVPDQARIRTTGEGFIAEVRVIVTNFFITFGDIRICVSNLSIVQIPIF